MNGMDLISHLTEREKDVFFLVIEGLSNRAIAKTLGITAKTVDTHKCRVKRKLGFDNAVQLARFAIRQGIIQA